MWIFDSFCFYIREKYHVGDKVQLAAPRTDDDLIISIDGLNYLDSKRAKEIIQKYEKLGNIPLSSTPIMEKFYLLTAKIGVTYPLCRIFNAKKLLKENKEENYLNMSPYEVLVGGVFKFYNNGKLRLISVENQACLLPSFKEENSFCDINELIWYLRQKADENDCEERYLISSKHGIISVIVDGKQLIKKDIDLKEIFSIDIEENIGKFLYKEVESDEKNCFYIINVKRGFEIYITMNTVRKTDGGLILESKIIEPKKTFKRLNAPCTSERELSFNEDIKEKPVQLIRKAILNSREK